MQTLHLTVPYEVLITENDFYDSLSFRLGFWLSWGYLEAGSAALQTIRGILGPNSGSFDYANQGQFNSQAHFPMAGLSSVFRLRHWISDPFHRKLLEWVSIHRLFAADFHYLSKRSLLLWSLNSYSWHSMSAIQRLPMQCSLSRTASQPVTAYKFTCQWTCRRADAARVFLALQRLVESHLSLYCVTFWW